MNKKFFDKELSLVPLNSVLVKKYSHDICESLDQIPGIDPHTLEQLLQEKSGDRILYKKWNHSFVVLEGESFVGVIIGYERKNESNSQYPYNSIYLSDLAVSKEYQRRGAGRFLVKTWLAKNKDIGFLELSGELRFSVQTNMADWNEYVQKLYESFGFKKISEKVYGNRVDNVYLLEF